MVYSVKCLGQVKEYTERVWIILHLICYVTYKFCNSVYCRAIFSKAILALVQDFIFLEKSIPIFLNNFL